MASRRIEDLVPELQDKYHAFAAAMKAAGLDFIVTCTARNYKEQTALYAQGREPLSRVNMYRIAAVLPIIGKSENNHKVTWTLRSKHVVNLDDNDRQNDLSRAFDIALVKHVGTKALPHWRLKEDANGNAIPDYAEAGRIGESVGLIWGGRFKNPDRPHFEV